MFPSSSNSCVNNPFLSYTLPFSNNNNNDDFESTFPHGYPNSSFPQSHLFTHHVGAAKKGKQTRKRATGKKDRHSKIYTAQGPRDRRMRLSLQIARKFFDLQDTLGFDKASKTIEWLFTKSKTAIQDLMSSPPHHEQVKYESSHVSECQDQEKEVMGGGENERKSRNTTLSKDCRDKARARARERTRDKMWRSLEKSKQCCFDANPNNYLGSSSSPFQLVEEDMDRSTLKSVEEEPKIITDLLEHQMATVGIMDKLFGMRSRDHGTCTFTDDFLGVQQDWSMGNNNGRSFYSNYGSTPNHDIDTIFSGHDDGAHHQHQNPSSSNIHLQHYHFLADH